MVEEHLARPVTAFVGERILLAGPIRDVGLAVQDAVAADGPGAILTFDDATGRVIDIDVRGTPQQFTAQLARVAARLAGPPPVAAAPLAPGPAARGRGRPKLGVVGREVTLLPRHWEWLAAQPGGASVVLRRLVDEARRREAPAQQARLALERAYRVMSALAGDLPGYEEALRALFAGDMDRLQREMADWPEDVRGYVLRLSGGFDEDAPAR